MNLQGQKVIVTGANRSIGRAIAIAFAREGADVFISYRSDSAGAEDTVQAIKSLGRQAEAIYADFSKSEGIQAFFSQAIDFLGSVDVLVNNAADYNTKSFLDLSVDEFEHMFLINVRTPMALTQLVAKYMIEHQIAGKIINISSISGGRPWPNRTANSTVKAALNMLTQSTAIELAPHNIRVNAIAPGTVPYEPVGTGGNTDDQANAAVFLASDASSWITGQILTVDGGQFLSEVLLNRPATN